MNRSRRLLTAACAALCAAACESDDGLAVYRAALFQINPQQSLTNASGTAEVILHGEDNLVDINLRAVGLDAVGHPTFLWSADGCPTRAADGNDDGIVDLVEGQTAYGGILLTLDQDITTQTLEGTGFPYGTAPLYGATANLLDVLDAVDGPDTDPDDVFVSLVPGEPLELANRTVVVHGVAPQVLTARPQVSGMAQITTSASVPILCGTLTLVP
jgi:hypothetical protein